MTKNRMLRVCAIGLCLFFVTKNGMAQQLPTDLVGTWLVEKKDGRVEIYRQGDKYYGKIVWLKEPYEKDGTLKRDINNPQVNLRSMTILGSIIVKDMKWNGKGKWDDGTVYDPDNGKTYSGFIKMNNKNSIELTGYIGFSFIGRSETWTRVN